MLLAKMQFYSLQRSILQERISWTAVELILNAVARERSGMIIIFSSGVTLGTHHGAKYIPHTIFVSIYPTVHLFGVVLVPFLLSSDSSSLTIVMSNTSQNYSFLHFSTPSIKIFSHNLARVNLQYAQLHRDHKI